MNNELVHTLQQFIDAAVAEGIIVEGRKANTLRGFVFQFVRQLETPEGEGEPDE